MLLHSNIRIFSGGFSADKNSMVSLFQQSCSGGTRQTGKLIPVDVSDSNYVCILLYLTYNLRLAVRALLRFPSDILGVESIRST